MKWRPVPGRCRQQPYHERDNAEHIREAVGVLSRYYDALGVREVLLVRLRWASVAARGPARLRTSDDRRARGDGLEAP